MCATCLLYTYVGDPATRSHPKTYLSHRREQHPSNLSNTYQLFFITNTPPLRKKSGPIRGIPNCLIPFRCSTPLCFWPDFRNVNLRLTLRPLDRIYNLVEGITIVCTNGDYTTKWDHGFPEKFHARRAKPTCNGIPMTQKIYWYSDTFSWRQVRMSINTA
jgi:hypothetical protein